MIVEELGISFLVTQANKLFSYFAIFEQNHSRNGLYAVFHSKFLFLIHVDFYNRNFALIPICQFVNGRSKHFARSTPSGKKVYQKMFSF